MKSIITIIAVLVSLNISLAKENTNPNSPNPEIDEVADRDGNSAVSNSSAAVETQDLQNEDESVKEHESDSSEYSVNKFNYLFYLIYKVKYLGFEEEVELGTKIGVE